MRLDFNVLWIEDQIAPVQAQKDRIAWLLRDKGFRLCVEFALSVEEATGKLSDNVYKDHVDLILIDYDLGRGMSGDEGLGAVRRIFPYRDIIFYSAKAATDLSKLVADQRVEGVFVSTRQELPDTVYGVFDNLIRKTLDIDHARGVALGALSEIEYAISHALSKTFELCDEQQRESTLNKLRNEVVKKRASYEKELNKIETATHVDELDSYHRVFTIDDKVRLLRAALEKSGRHAEHMPHFLNYQTNIIPRRNDLAHIRVVKNGFARTFYDRRGVEISSDNMQELRSQLISFEDLMEELFGRVDDLDGES